LMRCRRILRSRAGSVITALIFMGLGVRGAAGRGSRPGRSAREVQERLGRVQGSIGRILGGGDRGPMLHRRRGFPGQPAAHAMRSRGRPCPCRQRISNRDVSTLAWSESSPERKSTFTFNGSGMRELNVQLSAIWKPGKRRTCSASHTPLSCAKRATPRRAVTSRHGARRSPTKRGSGLPSLRTRHGQRPDAALSLRVRPKA